MDEISEEEFEKAKEMEPEPVKNEDKLTESEFNELLDEMQDPVLAQQKIAVQIKRFLDSRDRKSVV